jgi:polyhydroxybutyrate depolymerase
VIPALALALVALAGPAPERDAALLRERPYKLHVPAGTDGATPLPLVVALHCYGCDPDRFEHDYAIDRLASALPALVAVPRGFVDPDGRPFWNATDACCDFHGRRPDDVTYVLAVVRDVSARHRVDPARVLAFGMSNGGFLAHRLACVAPEVFRGVASLAGAGQADCAPSRPVAVLEIHGDADELVPMEGEPPVVALPGRRAIPSAESTARAWAKVNGCAPEPKDAGRLDLVRSVPGVETERREWTQCKSGGVGLWIARGAQHVEKWEPFTTERAVRWLLAHLPR